MPLFWTTTERQIVAGRHFKGNVASGAAILSPLRSMPKMSTLKTPVRRRQPSSPLLVVAVYLRAQYWLRASVRFELAVLGSIVRNVMASDFMWQVWQVETGPSHKRAAETACEEDCCHSSERRWRAAICNVQNAGSAAL